MARRASTAEVGPQRRVQPLRAASGPPRGAGAVAFPSPARQQGIRAASRAASSGARANGAGGSGAAGQGRRSEDADVDQLDDSGFESSQESNSTHATDSEQEQFGTVDIPPPTGRKWRFSRRLDPIRQGASESVEELRQGTQVRAAKVQIPYPSNLPSSSPSSPTPTTPEHLYVWVLIDRSTVHLDAVRWSYDWQDEQARWDTMFEIMSFAKEEEEAKEKERKKKDKAKGKGKAKGKEK